MLNAGKDINIIVADKHAIYRKALCDTIKNIIRVNILSGAANSIEAAQLMENETYQLLLVDEGIENVNNYALIRHINKRHPETYIIITGMWDNLYLVQDFYSSGCVAYLLKDADASEIMIAIETVMAGKKYYPEWMKE